MRKACRRLLFAAVTAACMLRGPAAAQDRFAFPPAIEAVASVASSSDGVDDPFVFLDLAATFPLAGNVDIIVRPYVRRLPGGDWDALLYQAQVRYQPGPGVRLDAGVITSPMGLGTLELRPDLNATVGYPFYYFGRLPLFDENTNRLQILSGGYPFGAVLSMSAGRWDARVGVTDGTPARYRNVLDESSPAGMPQVIAGGGVTLMPGLRIGGAIANGRYRSASDADYYGQAEYGPMLTNASALVINVEGEFAFRYTRLSGEWVRDRFESEIPAVSRGFYLQGVQTLTPRTFAAARLTRASSPVLGATGRTRWTRTVGELTGGYRVTPELTLRAGYEAEQAFGLQNWTHAAVFSVVWAKRWF